MLARTLIDEAEAASSHDDLRLRMLRRLQIVVGFDTAVFLDPRPEGGRPIPVNKERASYFFGLYASNPRRYQRRLHPMLDAVVGIQGACLDTKVFSARDRDRLPFYADIVRPQGIRSQLIARTAFRGTETGLIYLCRHGRVGGFREDALERLQRLVPLLGVLEAASGASRALPAGNVPPAMLTPREREIALHVAHGLRNRDIALVLGTSVNTVRNQVAALFEKLGVAGRAELAAWTIRAGLDR